MLDLASILFLDRRQIVECALIAAFCQTLSEAHFSFVQVRNVRLYLLEHVAHTMFSNAIFLEHLAMR